MREQCAMAKLKVSQYWELTVTQRLQSTLAENNKLDPPPIKWHKFRIIYKGFFWLTRTDEDELLPSAHTNTTESMHEREWQ